MLLIFHYIENIDFAILDFIREHLACGVLDSAMAFLSRIGDFGLVWIVISIVLFCFKKTRGLSLVMMCSLLVTYVTGDLVIKNLVMRVRPCNIRDVEMIIPKPSSYSFPSGHTASSFTAAFCIFLFNKKWGVCALALASLIAFSRLYNFVHFPSDVIGGIILGIGVALLFTFIYRKICAKKGISRL